MDAYRTKEFTLRVKQVNDAEGVFEGYASVFGARDSYNEMVEPGAFVESLVKHKREGTSPLMLWQHDPWSPIGVWDEIVEDNKGLRVKGHLLPGVQKADEALILLKGGAIQGLSIGYREIDTEPDDKTGTVYLKKLELIEVSIVSMPALKRARIDTLKADASKMLAKKLAAGDRPTTREWEKGLRGLGLSQKQAERAVSLCLKGTQGDPEIRTEMVAVKSELLRMQKKIDGFRLPQI